MKKRKRNFMDFIPVPNPDYAWDISKDEIVTVNVVNKGFYNVLAQKIFKKPRISHIKLDDYGSFVWKQLDGKRNVYEISRLVKKQFGKDAEPVVERLVQFIRILYQNKFIGYAKEKI